MSVIRVAYLGPPGTYSHQVSNNTLGFVFFLAYFEGKENAARQQFEAYTLNSEFSIIYLPQPSINSCFKAISKDECDYSIIPFENSSNGQVVLSYDLFRDWFIHEDRLRTKLQNIYDPNFTVIAEQFVSIHHNFITYSTDLTKINKIYSHPQVWSQCNKFLHKYELDNNIKIQKIDTSSTSQAVKILTQLTTDKEREETAAMASLTASEIHGVPVKLASIEDFKGNTTRFLVLGKAALPSVETGKMNQVSDKKMSLLTFVIKDNDDFGSLCDILQVFKNHNLNLQSITTRPSVIGPWRYVFFVEVWESEGLSVALKELEDLVLDLTVIGSFNRSERFFEMIQQPKT
ncbi:hypothetical protein CANARDRAFT_203543 [[Candida] arabinofermentans NRRL YB-2248]|uniref:prephenate dehydratase n=1 Tax=[Candida] arabinofermentans NRRL YB-2248 TaxID=983967 RepID=A0A1E4SUV3_9ASCO|nr:hypothetical protein CANARDRAFT_203543 [[Candida] arabinofermentans NRRL YB-2248]